MGFDAALTAWATLALAALALIAAVVAGGAWVVQARQLRELREVNKKQLPVLEGQRDELEVSRKQRDREETERREQFVTQVFCWHDLGADPRVPQAQAAAGAQAGTVSRTYIRNMGAVPVYDLGFAWWAGEDLVRWSSLATPLMPGTWAAPAESTASRPWTIPDDLDPQTITVAVFIRDAAGNRWRLRPGGHYELYDDGMLAPGYWKTT